MLTKAERAAASAFRAEQWKLLEQKNVSEPPEGQQL